MTSIAALESLSIRHPDRFYIGGEWVRPASSARFDVRIASTEEVFASVAEAQEADIEAAVRAARAAFDKGDWRRLSHGQRAAYLLQLAERIEARAELLSAIWTAEMGIVKTFAESLAVTVGRTFRTYAALAETFPFQEERTPSRGNYGLLVREPVGVVAAILPWNGPLGLLAYKVAPALLAGCTCIVKMPPEAPLLGYIFAEIAEEIGLPPGVINIVTADREVSELLVRHPEVDKVTFTGSSAAGRKIASICGERVARCTLELGGKSAAVVLDDYDVGLVAESLAASAPVMTGQVCASLTRIIVTQDRHDEMVDALASAMAKIRVGDPFDADTGMGPLAMARQRDRVEHYFARGREEGALVATGGGRPAHLNRGYFVEPTVFGRVDNTMTIAREEIFGPVLSVIPAPSEDAAIGIANDSVFGLNASVFTNDADRAYRAARELRSGTVGHNAQRIDFGIAFGGFKQSGIGREGGVEGLHPFLETKTVILDAPPAAR